MNHTIEPWIFIQYPLEEYTITTIESGDETVIDDISPEDGSRIVACVNACAGMENPADEIAKLKYEQREMLSAMKNILSINWRDSLKGFDRPTDFAEREAALMAFGKATDIARKAILTLNHDDKNQ